MKDNDCLNKITFEEIKSEVKKTIELSLRIDKYLFSADVSERSMTHAFAVHLGKNSFFKKWDIDCEYNRRWRNGKIVSKGLESLKDLLEHRDIKNIRPDDKSAKTVFPDIIIHKRGREENF